MTELKKLSSLRRFPAHNKIGKPMVLKPDHNAIFNMTTLFPNRVTVPDYSAMLFKSGKNNRKIGSHVTKGIWADMPVYTLTLEERATCPTICEHWFDCLAPGTRVLTSNLDWVPIETLKLGQEIVGFNEHASGRTERRKTLPSIVEALGRAKLPSYEITTTKGKITSSAGHLWLARRNRSGYKWMRADHLKPGDDVQYLGDPWTQDTSYQAGRIRGFMEGEGSVVSAINGKFLKSAVVWAQLPGTLINEINAEIKARGFDFSERATTAGVRNSEIQMMHLFGGWREVIRFLGTFKPSRLSKKIADVLYNHDISQGSTAPAQILKVRSVGKKEVITIATSTKTLIAEGYFTHNCFGNKMQWPVRWKAGAELEKIIPGQVATLARKHPDGFVVRLHVLGDFYSANYVRLWNMLMANFPALHVYGYTRREKDTSIGRWLTDMNMWYSTRWRVRWSERGGEMGTITTKDIHARGRIAEGIVCPAQTEGDAVSCGSCGLCWNSSEPIVFVEH